MHYHKRLQRRLMIAAGVIVLLVLAIGVPITVNDDLRYDLSLQLGLAPGKDAERLSDSDDGALLIVIPLDHGDADSTSPWLYRAQFIAWPNDAGNEIENLETGERVQVPLTSIEFTAANGDGSLVLMRGNQSDTGEPAAFTIAPLSMQVQQLEDAESFPDSEGDWETPTWEKTKGMCNRPSPNQRFVGCFARAGTSSYFAGDWQFDIQIWGDYETLEPQFRGRGFLPWVGFAQNDTVVYLQNERGIVRFDVSNSALEAAPAGVPYASPVASPIAAD